ncbi:MAG TPA: tRNA pseudouridine(55) synthase TruB [Negativicutes bacterium]
MISGIINVLKPPGMTSHDIVSFIRRTYGIKRVGHAGTLDPAAAGVLPVAIGQSTRLIEYMVDTDKSYRVELTFGYATDTGDDTGKIIHTADFDMPANKELDVVLASFVGEIEQVPPMYSAIKIAGKKLYELARAGITVERQPRKVTIYDITLLKRMSNSILFDVTCSKGTYMRSLCIDIGNNLGSPAVMSFLVRTRVGFFSLSESFMLEEITKEPAIAVLPSDFALGYMPKIILSPETAQAFQYGQNIRYDGIDQGLIRIYDEHGFLGIGQHSFGSSLLLPVKVLSKVQ